jgi:hypothetical protein
MKAPNTDQRKAAVAIGKACLQAQIAAENPELAPDKLRSQFTEHWQASRQSYVRLGNSIIRKLERAGFALTPAPGAAKRAPAKRGA